MTTQQVSANLDFSWAIELMQQRQIPPPRRASYDANGRPSVLEWEPDLSPEQAALVARICAAAATGVRWGPDDLPKLTAELDGLRALVSLPAPSAADLTLLTQFYQAANGSPTNAQRDAATKAGWRVMGSLARVVRAIVRDT
jgi:hypothetical protein